MTKRQTELIRAADTEDVDGAKWKKRMERWLKTMEFPPYYRWIQSKPYDNTTWIDCSDDPLKRFTFKALPSHS